MPRYTCESRWQLSGVSFLLQPVCLKDWTQIIRLGSKCLYSLNNLARNNAYTLKLLQELNNKTHKTFSIPLKCSEYNRRRYFQSIVVGQMDICLGGRTKPWPCLTSSTQINSRYVIDLEKKGQTPILPEENKGEYCHHFGAGIDFLHRIQKKTWTLKDKLDFRKNQNHIHQKRPLRKGNSSHRWRKGIHNACLFSYEYLKNAWE